MERAGTHRAAPDGYRLDPVDGRPLRLLFVPYSVPGHVHPVLPVLRALADRGHQVRVLIDPRFAPAVAATGAHPVPLTAVPDAYVPDGYLGAGGLRFAADRLGRLRLDRFAAVTLAAELRATRPDLAVLDPMPGWPDRVARRAGVPTAVLATTVACSAAVGAELARRYRPRWLAPQRLRAVQAMRPVVRRHRPGRLVLANTLAALQPAAGRLRPHVRLVGPLLPNSADPQAPADPVVPVEIARLAASGRPLLYVSPGTVFARGRRFFAAVVDAFAGTHWGLVLATGHTDPAALEPLPRFVFAARHVPQRAVLARASVFLSHAGMNSTQEALAAGVPMALAPRSVEQRHTADRLVALGVGALLEPTRTDPFDVVTALATDPAVRAETTRWRRRLAGVSGAAVAAELLIGAAAGSDPRTVRAAALDRAGDGGAPTRLPRAGAGPVDQRRPGQ